MSRRVSRFSSILALTLILSITPSAFAARQSPTFDDPAGPIERIVRAFKKVVKGFTPVNNYLPGPPIP